MTDSMPDPPVQTVQSMSVIGAKVMHGTWKSGETRVRIAPAVPYDTVDAKVQIENGELPQ